VLTVKEFGQVNLYTPLGVSKNNLIQLFAYLSNAKFLRLSNNRKVWLKAAKYGWLS